MADEVWIWPMPKPGETVPDYPPTDLTGAVAAINLDGDDRCCPLDTSDGVTHDHCLRCHGNVSVSLVECPRCARRAAAGGEDTPGQPADRKEDKR